MHAFYIIQHVPSVTLCGGDSWIFARCKAHPVGISESDHRTNKEHTILISLWLRMKVKNKPKQNIWNQITFQILHKSIEHQEERSTFWAWPKMDGMSCILFFFFVCFQGEEHQRRMKRRNKRIPDAAIFQCQGKGRDESTDTSVKCSSKEEKKDERGDESWMRWMSRFCVYRYQPYDNRLP